MIKIVFVITTNVNLGDLAFCFEWINELKHENYMYAFVIDPVLQKFIDKNDTIFLFHHDWDVKKTILEAVSSFKADILIFASNSYWNIKGQKGAVRGTWDHEILNLNIPILSFDPLEGLQELYIHLWKVRIFFPPVPEGIWSLRASPNISMVPKIRHFRINNRFNRLTSNKKCDVLNKINVDFRKKTVFFPIAKNCYDDCRKNFCDYYAHLSNLFQKCQREDIQFLILAPQKIDEFSTNDSVIQIGTQPYQKFIEILKASDIYLTDNGVASSFLHALSSSIPSILLCNSYDSFDSLPECHSTIIKALYKEKPENCSFIFDNLYPFRVFPYGMLDLFNHDERLYHIANCYNKAEVLEINDFSQKIESMLFDIQLSQKIMEKCAEFKSLYIKLPSPESIIEEVLSQPV